MELLLPSFIAGLLTFFAPCTLPLVPGYLAFISGTQGADENRRRRNIFWNGVAFIIGFSVVFIILGLLAGLLGQLFAPYQVWISRLAGVMIILFGCMMLGILNIPFLNVEKRFTLPPLFTRGTLPGSFVFGSAFSLGWTPCVGPVLGSVLLLASSTTTAIQGAILLGTFALGLAVPFLLVAASLHKAEEYIARMSTYLHVISMFGGVFLIVLGILVLTNNMAHFLAWSYSVFDFIGYGRLIEYL